MRFPSGEPGREGTVQVLLGAMSSRFAVINDDVNNGLRLRLSRHAPEAKGSRAGANSAGAHGLCNVAVGLVEHGVHRLKACYRWAR